MEEFNGMSRATVRDKTPAGFWEFARNIVLTRNRSSITNEEGFDYIQSFEGSFIGGFSTNDIIILLSVNNNGYFIIGYVKPDNTYTVVLRTQHLDYTIKYPIEIIGFYNYKQEPIIVFSNGNYDDSSSIKLINIFNIGVDLDVNLELTNPNDITLFDLNVITQEGTIDFSYISNSTLDIDIVYITYSYILDDNISNTPFFIIQDIAYPTYNYKDKNRRSISLSFNNLDNRFNKIRIGLLVNTSEGLVGYQSNIISYTGNSITYTLSSLSNFTNISIEELTIPNIFYNKAKTLTFQNNKLEIGNLSTDNTIPFQKYANMLEIEPIFIDDDYDNQPDINGKTGYEEDIFTHPSLCPDEVYSIHIEPQLLNGNFLEAFHIPGRLANTGETDLLDSTALSTLGLDLPANIYRKFHIYNQGQFVLPPPYTNSLNHKRMITGYWQNEEVYPNNIEYDSTIDYDGNPLGGIDNRGLPIRYTRMPGLDAIISKIPSLLGITEQNMHNKSYPTPLTNLFVGKVPRLGLRIINFDTVIPIEIRNKLQGFRILIRKRTEGNRIVEDINFIKQLWDSGQNVDETVQILETPVIQFPSNTINSPTFVEQFGKSVIFSQTLDIYKPSISPILAKANYGIFAYILDRDIPAPNTLIDILLSPGNIYKIPLDQQYATITDINYIPGNNLAAKSLFTEEKSILLAKNTLQGNGGITDATDNRWNPLLMNDNASTSNNITIDKYNPLTRQYDTISLDEQRYKLLISCTFINLNKNIYQGLSVGQSDFISLGYNKINTSNNILYKNGDIFVNNYRQYPIGIATGSTLNGRVYYLNLLLKGLYSITNNSSITITKDRDYRPYDLNGSDSETTILNTFQYDFTIFNEEVYRSLNDKIVALGFDINTPFINKFPFRVASSLVVANENLQTNNIRTFLANSYYEMPNTKGEIIALRGTTKRLYIQQKYALFVASIKDVLTTDEGMTYIGQGDIFDRIPEELVPDDKGYIGSTSQFACVVIPGYYVTVDQIQGKIFIISDGLEEISKNNMDIYFSENWNSNQNIDNPYNAFGHIVGYDKKYNRLLFTKHSYTPLFDESVYTFDGQFYYDTSNNIILFTNTLLFEDNSETFSFNLEGQKSWICNHDYYPKVYINNNKGLFSISPIERTSNTNSIFKHNSLNNKGYYYDVLYSSYVDLVFNSRLDLVKLYQSIMWNTTVILNNSTLYFKTIDAIIIYTNNQCSDLIDFTNKQFILTRNTEGIWNFNEFRDIVINNDDLIIDNKGNFNTDNLNNTMSWFAKSNFISTFIVIRLIMNNTDNSTVNINGVNVKSRISQR